MPAKACESGCQCYKHNRTKQHNERIRAGVKLAQADMRARGENTSGTRTYEQKRDAALKGKNMFKDAQTVDALIAQLIGFGSKCWKGDVFDSELASKGTDARNR